jgi:dolichol-phosphate mannosyltransferase
MSITYSVVVPIKNEEENIDALVQEVELVMESLGKKWELIFVDDGSTDRSLVLLQALCKHKPYLRILSFTRNFGQSAAFAAGFHAAKGAFIITLDGDRQNDPADIPKLLEAIAECDLVVGWRVNRRDTFQKRVISLGSNWVRSRLCRDGMHDTGCSLKVYRKEALLAIKMYRGMHRFLPALFKIEGFRVKEIPVNHRERSKGRTKYHFFNRSLSPILDMLVVCWMHNRALHHQIREEITHEQLEK